MRRFAVLTLAALLFSTTTEARPKHVLAMVRIEAGDLDLATTAGAAAMIKRLDRAASDLCAGVPSPLFPGREGRAWRCRREAVAAAVQRLRTPALAAAHHAWLSAEPDADPQARSPG